MTTLCKRELRQAFGAYPTGVVVVAALNSMQRPVGFTANSFASVSLEPPLLLVCPAKTLSCYGVFERCRRFSINVLSERQSEISQLFAQFKGDRFGQVAWSANGDGLPHIDGAAAHFSCRTHQTVNAGDHLILIGEVTDFTAHARSGLGYRSGHYFTTRQTSELPI